MSFNARNNNVLRLMVFWRIISVFVVQTYFVPDEYWQSLEVSHNFVFGYGYYTWEWDAKIRSFIYPAAISLIYKILALLHLDFPSMLTTLPRIFQAVLSAYGDYRFFVWTKSKWALFNLCINWFWYYCATRTLINTLETSLTMIALSIFPWRDGTERRGTKFLWIVGLLCALRPTAAIMWIPLCLYHLLTDRRNKISLLIDYAVIASVTLAYSVAIDSLFYGEIVVTPWLFFKFNVLSKISDFYGKEPILWYLYNGLPTLLGIQYLMFFLALIRVRPGSSRKELLMIGTVLWTILVYSCISHKEFRFILPLLPMILYIATCSSFYENFRITEFKRKLLLTILVVSNLLPGLYISLVHQRGSLDLMRLVRNELSIYNDSNVDILFLTPCHATPLYSHLHRNISVRFLTCEPNYDVKRKNDDSFFEMPSKWLEANYGHKTYNQLPTHIVTYDNIPSEIKSFLRNYRLLAQVFDTHFPLNGHSYYLNLYRRKKVKNGNVRGKLFK